MMDGHSAIQGSDGVRRAILFTGLIRAPDKFENFLTFFEKYHLDSGIQLVFSTWVNELNAYPAIAEQLNRIGALIVKQPQPNLVLAGHILHQLVCLDAGLSQLDDDVFVLKLRPDFGQPMDVDNFLRHAPQPAPAGRVIPAPFKHFVYIRSVFGAQPFYINDITFAGMAADLRYLARLPFVYLTRYVRIGPEQLYWGGSIVDQVPVFDAFFRVNIGLIFHDTAQYTALRAALIASPLFARVMACTAIMMTEDFLYFGGDPNRTAARAGAAKATLEALLWDPGVSIPDLDHHATAFTNRFQSMGFWDAVRAGEYAPSELGDRVRAAVAEYTAPNAIAIMQGQRATLFAEAAALAQRIEETVRLGGLKHFRADGPHKVIMGQEPGWTMGQTGTELTKQMERENNELRRAVERLTSQLGARQAGST
jgi:hypothetical protein